MNEKKILNKDKNINQNTENEKIIQLLHKKLDKKHINIPNDQSIKIFLQNEDIKNLISFTLTKHTEIEQELIKRKKVSFYFVNNQKIDEYIKLKSVNEEKNKKLLELKEKLNKIKEQRKNYNTKNEELLKEINDQEKKDKLARVKLKILNNTNSSLILDLKNEYKKYTYINGYKYSHLYARKNIGAIIENESEEDENEIKENFNKIKDDKILNVEKIKDEDNTEDKKGKNEEQISFISLNDMSSLNDSKINQIVNLSKLSKEEIIK